MVIFQRLQNILLYRVKRFFFAMNWNVSQLILVVNYCTLTFLSNTDILYSMLIILAKFGIKTFFLKYTWVLKEPYQIRLTLSKIRILRKEK